MTSFEKITSKINEVWIKPCYQCKSDTFLVQGITQMPVHISAQAEVVGLPYAVIVCKGCGIISNYALGQLDLQKETVEILLRRHSGVEFFNTKREQK